MNTTAKTTALIGFSIGFLATCFGLGDSPWLIGPVLVFSGLQIMAAAADDFLNL